MKASTRRNRMRMKRRGIKARERAARQAVEKQERIQRGLAWLDKLEQRLKEDQPLPDECTAIPCEECAGNPCPETPGDLQHE